MEPPVTMSVVTALAQLAGMASAAKGCVMATHTGCAATRSVSVRMGQIAIMWRGHVLVPQGGRVIIVTLRVDRVRTGDEVIQTWLFLCVYTESGMWVSRLGVSFYDKMNNLKQEILVGFESLHDEMRFAPYKYNYLVGFAASTVTCREHLKSRNDPSGTIVVPSGTVDCFQWIGRRSYSLFQMDRSIGPLLGFGHTCTCTCMYPADWPNGTKRWEHLHDRAVCLSTTWICCEISLSTQFVGRYMYLKDIFLFQLMRLCKGYPTVSH